jgi:hypothetical protein
MGDAGGLSIVNPRQLVWVDFSGGDFLLEWCNEGDYDLV